MNNIVEYLQTLIPLRQSLNNKKVWISSECPFGCGDTGTRTFRYHTQLKVGKAFCCGNSFKEKYWLDKLIRDIQLKNKLDTATSNGFEKINWGDESPF